jgi:hypothetical protein
LRENRAQKRFYASKTESALTPMGHAPTSDAGTAFDGLWEFEASGGRYCALKSHTFQRVVSDGVIGALNGKQLGAIAKDGSFQMIGWNVVTKQLTVEAHGMINGETGEGSFASIGTRCGGSYRIRMVRRLNR